MASTHPQRKLRNVKLTRKYHYRYLGLWALIFICLVLVCNVVVFMYAEEVFRGPQSLDDPYHAVYVSIRNMIILALCIETLFVSTAVIWLAKFTAHRIAGPYIRLQNVFNAVRDGDLNVTLKFRSYDHLEDVENAFNAMMKSIAERVKGSAL